MVEWTSGNSIPVEEFDGSVRFQLVCGGVTVSCRVQREVLDELAIRRRSRLFKSTALFAEYRDVIEGMAALKYFGRPNGRIELSIEDLGPERK